MNNRMQIAAQMMAARMQNPHKTLSDRAAMAEQAVKDADALIAALAESEVERPQSATDAHDAVGDWRKYVRPDGKRALMHVAAGNMAYVDDAFIWRGTPQGFDFWDNILFARCSDAVKARAQDFARSVLEAMEASDE